MNLSPKQIVVELDKYIIGQKDAKKALPPSPKKEKKTAQIKAPKQEKAKLPKPKKEQIKKSKKPAKS